MFAIENSLAIHSQRCVVLKFQHRSVLLESKELVLHFVFEIDFFRRNEGTLNANKAHVGMCHKVVHGVILQVSIHADIGGLDAVGGKIDRIIGELRLQFQL